MFVDQPQVKRRTILDLDNHSNNMMLLDKIQTWYNLNCDGDWEHSYGVKIATLDNPGWSLIIDLKETALEGLSLAKSKNVNDDDWYDANIENDTFVGHCSINNLNELFCIYVNFLEEQLPLSKAEYIVYAPILDNVEKNKIWRPLMTKMVGLNEFEVLDCPKMGDVQLKVKDVSDFSFLDSLNLDLSSLYQIGDIVSCELVRFFDYPSLVIIKKLKAKGIPPRK
jgi:hypothetical protein